MLLRRFVTPGLAINSYLLCDEKSQRGVLIDPTRQLDVYIASALKDNIEITDIIETHVHADFVSGALELKSILGGKPTIHCSGMGGAAWTPSYVDRIVNDYDEIDLGSIRLQALHTPGHSSEHLIWLVFDTERSKTEPEIVFTGDLLFVGSVGRPDLLDHEQTDILIKQLYCSLFSTIQVLPDFIEIFPAHGAGSLCGKEISAKESSTMGYEKRCNPWLSPKPFEEWQKNLLTDIPSVPSYFHHMKKTNLQGLPENRWLKPMPDLIDEKQLHEFAKTCTVVDIRTSEAFKIRHYKGSINVPFGPMFPNWISIVVPEYKDIVLVMEHNQDICKVMQSLRLIGIDRIHGIFTTDQWPIKEENDTLSFLPSIQVKDLQQNLSKFLVLDVRTPFEWNTGYIENAHHIELTDIPVSMQQLPKNQTIAVVCRSGSRASLVTSLLVNAGFSQALVVSGGMQAWIEASFPIIVKQIPNSIEIQKS